MSRSPNITPEQIDAIEAMIVQGVPPKHAVAQLGLSYNTFRKQLERGNKDMEEGEPHGERCTKCDRACTYCIRRGHAPEVLARHVTMSRTRPARVQLPLDNDDDAT